MIDAEAIPTEIWMLISSFFKNDSLNPLLFVRLSQICRSANTAFRSDTVWKSINPRGLKKNIYKHFTARIAEMSRVQRSNMYLVWEYASRVGSKQNRTPSQDTLVYRLNENKIPGLDDEGNDYYNLGLLVCLGITFGGSDYFPDSVGDNSLTNKVLIKNAIALNAAAYQLLTEEIQRNKDIASLAISQCASNQRIWEEVQNGPPRASYKFLLPILQSAEGGYFKLHGVTTTPADRDRLASAMVRHKNHIPKVSRRFLEDPKFILDNIAFQGALYSYAPPELQQDPEFRRKAVLASPGVVDATMDIDLWKLAVWAHPDQDLLSCPREFLPTLMLKSLERATEPREWFRKHRKLLQASTHEGVIKSAAVELFCGLGRDWPDCVPHSREKVLEIIKGAVPYKDHSGHSTVYIPRKYSDDREIVIAAVTKEGRALEYASESMRDDEQIVSLAVEDTQTPVLKYVSSRLRKNHRVVKKALAYHGYNLQYCTPKIKIAPDFAKLALANFGNAMIFIPDNYRGDPELVLRARCSERPLCEELFEDDSDFDRDARDDAMDAMDAMMEEYDAWRGEKYSYGFSF